MAELVRAMVQGLDPATGEVRCAPLWRADPRSKPSQAVPDQLVGDVWEFFCRLR